MQRRDYIIIEKILSEIKISAEMLGDTDLETFLSDEKLKRAVGMTVINIGELVKNITEETRMKYLINKATVGNGKLRFPLFL